MKCEEELTQFSASTQLLGKVVIGFSNNKDADSEVVLRYVLGLIKGVLGDGIIGKRKREQEEDEDEDDDDLASSDSEADDDDGRGDIKITTKSGKMKSAGGPGGLSKKKKSGAVDVWQPSMHTVHNKQTAREAAKAESKAASKTLDGASTPKLTGRGRHGESKMADGRGLNDPAVSCGVVFGLKLLYSFLKKSKLDWAKEEVLR